MLDTNIFQFVEVLCIDACTHYICSIDSRREKDLYHLFRSHSVEIPRVLYEVLVETPYMVYIDSVVAL